MSARRLLSLTATTLMSTLITSAWAQSPTATTAPSADEPLETFEVRASRLPYRSETSVAATRVATDLRDLPINVAIVTSDFMQDAQIFDIIDTLQYKGVNANRDVRFNSMFIRGFNNTVQKRNGIRRQYNWQTVNIEQVEIVKGPASILYGAVLPGGAVMSVSKTPLDHPHADVSLTLGQYDFRRGVLDAGSTLGAEDELSFRFIGELQDSEDYYDLAFVDRNLVNPTVRWKPSEQFHLDFEYERVRHREHQVNYMSYYNEDSVNTVPAYPDTPEALPTFPATGFSWGFLPLPRGNHNSAPGNEFQIDSDWYELTLTFNPASDWTVRWKTAWEENEALYRTATVGRLAYAGGMHGLIRPGASLSENRNLTTFVEATGRIDLGAVDLVPLIGAEYATRTTTQFNYTNQPAGEVIRLDEISSYMGLRNAPAPIFQRRPDTDSENTSVYGLLQAEWSNGFRMLGALRYEEGETNPEQRGVGPGNSFDATSAQLGFVYKFSPQYMTFLNISESFVPNTTVNPDGTTLPLEEGRGAELGLRSYLLDDRLSLTTTVYWTERDKMARLDTGRTFDPMNNPNQLNYYTTSGKERVSGFELEAYFAPSDTYQVSLSYNWLPYAEVISFANRPDIEGNRLRYAPEHGIGFWNRLKLPGVLPGLFAYGGVTYQSQTVWDSDKQFTTITFDPFTNVDAGLGWEGELGGTRYSFEVLGKNLTDNVLTTTYRPQDRRRWLLTVGAHF